LELVNGFSHRDSFGRTADRLIDWLKKEKPQIFRIRGFLELVNGFEPPTG
jgi:hypothetical protein